MCAGPIFDNYREFLFSPVNRSGSWNWHTGEYPDGTYTTFWKGAFFNIFTAKACHKSIMTRRKSGKCSFTSTETRGFNP